MAFGLSSRTAFATVCMMLLVLSVTVILPYPSRAPSIDPYEVPPGNPLWFPLEGFDSKGEVLHYTITFKKSLNEDGSQRPIDFILIERSIADQNPTKEIAMQLGLLVRLNISERTVGEWKNDRDSQIMAMFYNHLRAGDTKDWDNASVRIRFDYYLTGEAKEKSSPVLTIIAVSLSVAVLVVVMVILVRRFVRSRKEAVTFFTPEEGPYYVVRALNDSRVFYLDPDQYSQLYSSGRLNEFEFLGTSPRMGGMIIPPEGQGTGGALVLEAQPLPDAPLQEAFANEDLLNVSAAVRGADLQPMTAGEGTGQEASFGMYGAEGTIRSEPSLTDLTGTASDGSNAPVGSGDGGNSLEGERTHHVPAGGPTAGSPRDPPY